MIAVYVFSSGCKVLTTLIVMSTQESVKISLNKVEHAGFIYLPEVMVIQNEKLIIMAPVIGDNLSYITS